MAYQDPSPGSTTTDGSTTDVAKEQAGRVGQKASEAGGQVAQTTKEQAQNVVGEAKQQARDLVGEARTQVRGQTVAQRDRAVQGLRSISDELEQMAQQGGQSGIVAEVARQIAGRTRDVAGHLERNEPSDLIEQVRAYARRRPVVFLAGATLAGVLAGRLTKGLSAGAPDSGPRQLPSGGDYGTGYGTDYGTGTTTYAAQPVAVETAEPYAADYPAPAYGTQGDQGYAAPDQYATTPGGFREPDAGYGTGQGDEYGGTPGGYPPPATPYDPDQPPARGWTP